MKIVLNKGTGIFKLSSEAIARLIQLGWTTVDIDKYDEGTDYAIDIILYPEYARGYLNESKHGDRNSDEFRMNPDIVTVFEELGNDGIDYNSFNQQLDIQIIEIPDDIEWYRERNSNGFDEIHEAHRIW